MRKALLAICFIPFLCQSLVTQTKITPAEAKSHIGEKITVCGNVAGTRLASSTPGQPTLLDLDKRYPNQLFTVVIWSWNRSKFGNPEVDYRGKNICVTGKVEEYGRVPQIDARTPGQISVAAGLSYEQTHAIKFMIFGGEKHATYLGCLNCPKALTDSVFNENGQHGSRDSASSIWNKHGEFGSIYSQYGVCSPYSSDPPIILDQNGKQYGRLTLNRYHSQFGIGDKYYDWLKSSVCKGD